MDEPPEEHEQRVTPLELFFDLVFVYAITQVTRLMARDPTWQGVGRGLAVLAAIWWTWTGYAWLTNALEPEEGNVCAGMFGAMAAMLVVALAIPDAFGEDAMLFAVAYFVVGLLNLVLFPIAGRRVPSLLRPAARALPTVTIGPLAILAAASVEGPWRATLWVVALAVMYASALIGHGKGWHVSPAHFAERYGLIVIIALRESVIAIGFGAEGVALDSGAVAAVVLGIAVIAALWWAYFDVIALRVQRQLSRTSGAVRARLARDLYPYLHLPMIAGIVLPRSRSRRRSNTSMSRWQGSPPPRSAAVSRSTTLPTSRSASAWSTPCASVPRSVRRGSGPGGSRPASCCSRSSRWRSRSRRSHRSRSSRRCAGRSSHGTSCITVSTGSKFDAHGRSLTEKE